MTLPKSIWDDTPEVRKFINNEPCENFEEIIEFFRKLFDDYCIADISADDFVCGIILFRSYLYCSPIVENITYIALRRASNYWFTIQDSILSEIASMITDTHFGNEPTTAEIHFKNILKPWSVDTHFENANKENYIYSDEYYYANRYRHVHAEYIIDQYKGTGTNLDIATTYLNYLDIGKILLVCDKLAMTAHIVNLINVNIKSPTRMTIIHHGYTTDNYDDNYSQIAKAYEHNHYLLFNDIFTYRYPREIHFRMAVSCGLRVDELIFGDDVFDMTPELRANLKSLDCGPQYNLRQISFDQCTSLTSLNIRNYVNNCVDDTAKPNANIYNLTRLRSLNCNGNKKFTTLGSLVNTLSVLFMANCNIEFRELGCCTSLEKLVCDGVCGYIDPSIRPFDLSANSLKILSWADVDRPLHCDDCLSNCVKLEKFCCTDNAIPFSQFSLPSLRVLIASGKKCSVCDDTIRFCTTIEELNCNNNIYITTCKPFAKSLRILHARESAISDVGLSKCAHIEELDCMDNDLITTCAPFGKSLLRLNMIRSGIINDKLCDCKHIEILVCDLRNPKCESFIKSLKVLVATGSASKVRNEIRALHSRVCKQSKIKFFDGYNNKLSKTYFRPMQRYFAWE